MRGPWKFLIPLLAVLVLAGGLSAFVLTSNSTGNSDLAELSEVIDRLQRNFIDQDKLTTEDLNRAAIQGIIQYLDDPYTSYLAPQQYQSWAHSLSGEATEFEGIGAQVTMRNDQIMILGPLPGSPAGQAGIRPGDVVLEVDGRSVEGMDLLEAVALIRGPKGTEVTLLLSRPGEVRPVEVSVVRDSIELSSVSARVHDDGIGVIHLESFDARTVDNLRSAVERLRQEGVEGLVLDLRYNTGGLVDAAVGVVSEFIESGVAFTIREGDGTETAFEVNGEGTAYDIPMVVLTNGFTASAGEILTGALQDYDRATVIGTTTFGKGSVSILFQLNSGAGFNVTTARWLTPNGRIIEGEGLAPDIEVRSGLELDGIERIGSLAQSLCEAFEADRAELDGHPEAAAAIENLCAIEASPAPVDFGEDVQMDAAVETLRGIMGANQ